MKRKLEISAATLHGDRIWFFAAQFNGLFYKEIETGHVQNCGKVPWDDDREMLYRGIEYSNNKIYLIPYAARSVAVYDIKNMCFYEIKLYGDIVDGKKFMFRASFAVNDKVYAFGQHVYAVMSIDSKTDELELITDNIQNVNKIASSSRGILSRKQIGFLNNKVYLPMFYANALVCFDLNTEQIKILEFSSGDGGYSGICIRKNEIFLAGKSDSGTVLKINIDTNIHQPVPVGNIKHLARNMDIVLLNIKGETKAYSSNYRRTMISSEEINLVEGDFECVGSELNCTYLWQRNTGNLIIVKGHETTSTPIEIEMAADIVTSLMKDGTILREKVNYGLKEFIEDLSC